MKKVAWVALALLAMPFLIPLVQAGTTFVGAPVQLNAGSANIGTVSGSTVSVVGLNGAAISVSATLGASTFSVVGLNGAPVSVSVQGTTVTVVGLNGAPVNTTATLTPSTVTVVGLNGAPIVTSVGASTFSVVGLNGAPIPVSVAGTTVSVVGLNGAAVTVAGAVTNAGTFAVQAVLSQSTVSVVGLSGGLVATSVSPSTFSVVGLSGLGVATMPQILTTITRSSQTLVLGTSTIVFAADANRKSFEMTALPTNTDTVFCDWTILASTVSTIVLSPGSNYSSTVGGVQTAQLSCMANSGSQIVRGSSYAP